MSNLLINGYANARYDYNKAKNTEKRINNFAATMGLGATGVIAYSANSIAKSNPKTMVKLYKGADKYVGKGLEKTFEYGGKVLNKINATETGKKITDKISGLFMKGAKKIAKTKTGKNLITKGLEKIEKFCNLSSAKRGKYMLVAAGITAAVGTAIHIIRQHDRNDGAIDQKYKDIEQISKIL